MVLNEMWDLFYNLIVIKSIICIYPSGCPSYVSIAHWSILFNNFFNNLLDLLDTGAVVHHFESPQSISSY